MVEECVCGDYRADHDLNADWCKRCDCRKFRLGRLVDVRTVLRNLIEFCKSAQMSFQELDEADKALTSEQSPKARFVGRERMSRSIGEKLDQIIAEASAFSEHDLPSTSIHTNDAFRRIVGLAQDINNQLEDRLGPAQDANGECVALNEAISHGEELEQSLARALRVQKAICTERNYAEGERDSNKEQLEHVQARLSALHEEFRIAAQWLKFVANWLTNTYAKGPNSDATAARGYASTAKEVLDKGLDWLVERNRNRGRGVRDSTAASKSAGEGSTPSARAIERVNSSCRRCESGNKCVYAKWSGDYIWLEVEQRLQNLASSNDVVWNLNQQRAILNLMWHYRYGGRAS